MTAKRFKETISTGIVTDTITGKEYKCEMRIDDKLLELLNELAEKNEQLKQSQGRLLQELLIYRKIANCSNCKYQNYDWFDDGDEFEICEKGNTNQQIAYHICKEWRELE